MSRWLVILGFIAALAPAGMPVRADVPPPPGSRERAAAELIRERGYACERVTGLAPAPQDDAASLAAQGLQASTALCSNGRRFVVAVPIYRPGPPPPNAPPAPAPVVRPLP